MTQDLIWEQFPYPVELKTLLEGNSPALIFDPSPVTAIRPPQPPQESAWVNKTGSTNGFGAYVAFVPAKRLGIVILANTSFPIEDRVTVAYTLLRSLAAPGGPTCAVVAAMHNKSRAMHRLIYTLKTAIF
jgi:beta-lactamase class C